MHYQISLLCTVASVTLAAKSSSSSASILLPRQTSDFLVGGSKKPYPAGETGPGTIPLSSTDGYLPSLIFPGDWPDTAYGYTWVIDNEIMRKTQLGSEYGSESPGFLDTTPVQCWCAAGSLCSCEKNDDVDYLDMLVSRSVEFPDEDDNVIMPGLDYLPEYGAYIMIKGTVLGTEDNALLSNVSDSEDEEDNEEEDNNDNDEDGEDNSDDVDSDTNATDSENEDTSNLSSDDEAGSIQEIISADSAHAVRWLSTWSIATIAATALAALM